MSSDLQHIGLDIGSFFKQKNIPSVFTLCGGHISPILVGCEKENINIIQVRDEVSAVFGIYEKTVFFILKSISFNTVGIINFPKSFLS